ncbi:MAG TPA: tetratricopeptide repeat protein [Candidatus Limnocylindrales bacterium]|nr:tetratricopeptide repeat protein [Candidatus Limnocylindrales bacterium]
MTSTGPAAFCTQCGTPAASGARFCTACGAPLAGGAAAAPSTDRTDAAEPRKMTPAAIGVLAVMLAVGGVSAYFALREDAAATRAVPGAPTAPAPGERQQQQAEGSLPQGHPSLELPQEVVAFLDQLTAEAEKNPNDVEAHLRLARARYRASVLNATYRQAAQQALDKLLALDPEHAEGIRIAANLAYDRGDFAQAEKGFLKFLARHPDDASALTDLGSTLLFQDRPDEAVAQYRRALEKDEKFLQARFNLGITLQKLGKSEEALVELKKAAQVAETPEQKQHVENAIAEIEGREPARIAKAPTDLPADHPPIGEGATSSPGAGAAPAASSGSGDGGSSRVAVAGSAPAAPGSAHTPKTNASSDFQREAEALLVAHPIMGQRIRSFEWTGTAAARVMVGDFPMDKMPPVVRNKFKSGMNEKLTALATARSIADPIHLELVDPETSQTMDKLDGKEMVGAFAVQQ